METIELARALAAHGETEDARNAFLLTLQQVDGSDPAAELEAALYVFENGGDYRVPYTTFLSLYNRGHFQEELFNLMVGAFYAPNLTPQQRLYERNCKLLDRYKYCFRKTFLAFDDLPIKLFAYNDEGFVPFDTRENHFKDYISFSNPVVSRNFFHDLEKPVLATDVYSQYELEYLNDNVRPSEWAARENHIYLHYTDWTDFCSYLQCLDFRDLLKSEKLVFLFEEEEKQYPIDFKERFGIDYTAFTVKPFSIKEVNRLIWHTQLSAHNGGDFFNEIFYGHPNLIAGESLMFETVKESVGQLKLSHRQAVKNKVDLQETMDCNFQFNADVIKQMLRMKELNDKDAMVALFLGREENRQCLDIRSRISPVIFFQPHFSNIIYKLTADSQNRAVLFSKQYEEIMQSSIFKGFRYIKTFTPMRRMTTSYGATVKFMHERAQQGDGRVVVSDAVTERVANRSFMIDWQDRLYKDSVLVRFEDGKLNPKATFTALAAFLDIPYTDSMTFCSGPEGINPETMPGNARGFDTAAIYRTYDEFANDKERYFIEYFMRDAYAQYGYDLHYYDGGIVDERKVRQLIAEFSTIDGYVRQSVEKLYAAGVLVKNQDGPVSPEESDELANELVRQYLDSCVQDRIFIAGLLMRDLHFINKSGQPLHMMPALKLDPALLEQPLYH